MPVEACLLPAKSQRGSFLSPSARYRFIHRRYRKKMKGLNLRMTMIE